MTFFSSRFLGFVLFSLVATASHNAKAQLSPGFYTSTCPSLQSIVRAGMQQAIKKESRIGASILRLFFHDCFVNGCDASLLLDDTSTFTGEKTAPPNLNSVRGFEVIDSIKTQVESACKGTVSCADIVALAALEGTKLLGGPSWSLGLGRKDAKTTSLSAVGRQIPPPTSSLSTLITLFSNKGLDATDMTALSGAHTIGQARCTIFRARIYNDTNIDSSFAATRRAGCPFTGGDGNLAPIDVHTPTKFDNNYYKNLLAQRGLFHSDQELFNGGSQDSLTRTYGSNQAAFFKAFSAAMTKMSNLGAGNPGEIRKNCRVVN